MSEGQSPILERDRLKWQGELGFRVIGDPEITWLVPSNWERTTGNNICRATCPYTAQESHCLPSMHNSSSRLFRSCLASADHEWGGFTVLPPTPSRAVVRMWSYVSLQKTTNHGVRVTQRFHSLTDQDSNNQLTQISSHS